MTTLMTDTFVCRVCGQPSDHRVIMSTNSFGYMDLDSRPAEMQRSTMRYWVQQCPHCGYVAPEISDESSASEAWLMSDEYLSLDGVLMDDEAPDLAVAFYRRHKLQRLDGDAEGAAVSLLRAAWCCDDEGMGSEAARLRTAFVQALDEMAESGTDLSETLQVMRLDAMRRAGMFDRIPNEYREGMFGGGLLDQIVAFELERAREHDPRCLTVGHATGKEDVPPLEDEEEDDDDRLDASLERRWAEMLERLERSGISLSEL